MRMWDILSVKKELLNGFFEIWYENYASRGYSSL